MSFLLPQFVTRSAQNFPDRPAVVFGDRSISYRELDELTNKVARILADEGVKRGDRVGIYMNKCESSVVSIYGILKAGAVYVPLDANAPEPRIAYIIDNCNIRCMLTSTAKAETAASLAGQTKSLRTAILMDDKKVPTGNTSLRMISWKDVLSYHDASLPWNPSIETDLAYILYTSGSTGTPKGVMITHLNVLTFIRWVADRFQPGPDDRFSNHAPLHFDLSTLDIFTAMMVGASVYPVPESLSVFPVRLADWIDKSKISIWYSVPSILSMMVLHGMLDRLKFEKLRIVFFAGEVFPVKYLRELMKLVPRPGYYNLYGPTETNVITWYQVPDLPAEQTKPIPIGKACENMEVFALGDDGTVVTAPGKEGELVGRGSFVAMGYWGDPEKTAKGFVPNPVQPHFGERIYRTGDIVMLDERGDYIYVGRRDHMIKSRGYRIEIGEIEAAIYSHPEIKEAAVIPIPDEIITNKIKAYVVLQNGKALDATDIRGFCSEKLPHYMVPEIIEFRDDLPKTSTGKINKPALVAESLGSTR
jgi:amino acid adenylation domain-containing protein